MSKSIAMTTRVASNGRVVLPIKARRKLNLKSGSLLNVVVKEHAIVLEDQVELLRRIQKAFAPYRPKPGEKLVSEELIEERRQAALRGE